MSNVSNSTDVTVAIRVTPREEDYLLACLEERLHAVNSASSQNDRKLHEQVCDKLEEAQAVGRWLGEYTHVELEGQELDVILATLQTALTRFDPAEDCVLYLRSVRDKLLHERDDVARMPMEGHACLSLPEICMSCGPPCHANIEN